MKECTIDLCDRRATRRGWCAKHYNRWRIYGDPNHPLQPVGRPPNYGPPRPCDVWDECGSDAWSRNLCGTHLHRLRTHGDPRTGARQPSEWSVDAEGYVSKSIDGRWVKQHRWVVEQAGIKIPRGHVVHHINHDKTDNRIENLRVMSRGDHAALHVIEDGVTNQFGVWPVRRGRGSDRT